MNKQKQEPLAHISKRGAMPWYKAWAIRLGAIVALVYQVLGIFEIVPAVSEDSVISTAAVIINLLVALGVVVDPTTSGVSDSTRALCYECPKEDD